MIKLGACTYTRLISHDIALLYFLKREPQLNAVARSNLFDMVKYWDYCDAKKTYIYACRVLFWECNKNNDNTCRKSYHAHDCKPNTVSSIHFKMHMFISYIYFFHEIMAIFSSKLWYREHAFLYRMLLIGTSSTLRVINFNGDMETVGWESFIRSSYVGVSSILSLRTTRRIKRRFIKKAL